MRALSLYPALAASAFAHNLPELAIAKRDRHSGGATQHFRRGVPLERRAHGATVSTNVFDVLTWSVGGAYYANITVGTPPQQQTVILDTGSSDLYLDAAGARTCHTAGATACKGGTFDPSQSGSYQQVAASPAFNTTFGDGSSATGPYGTDVVGIGNMVVRPVRFGVAEHVTSTTGFSIGLMGVGYSANEAVQSGDAFYPNMPEVLKDAGLINSRLYSIFLNDAEADSGTILFGGIDRAKFTGDMATVDLLPAVYRGRVQDDVDQFITTVTGASATVGGETSKLWTGGTDGIAAYGRTDAALPVLLDTGSTAWSIPDSYYRSIARKFSYVSSEGITDCRNADSGDFLSLEFAGEITIRVDARQFIVPLINSTTRESVPIDDAGNEACLFLLQAAPSNDDDMGFETLGDAILRSMYVVFDLDNGQASIAQAAVNSTASPDVVIVEAGAGGVAKALGSGVATAAANLASIAPQASATASFVASTAATPVGTATGEAAIPDDAQVEGDATSSGGASSTSSGIASGLTVPRLDLGCLWMAMPWVAGVAIGAGLML